uniref:Uncharacterized protein n=1 Tax=Cyanothece sp. (strain PCC 7425 / ATCC 29141) TaxID=395961 RepID=B8HVR5_CYAP4
MHALNHATRRRLQQLRQVPSVWEGDCQLLPGNVHLPNRTDTRNGACILWVDSSMGMVRAMDIVDGQAGWEAIVRTLLQAMEYPQCQAPPARPQRILVRDRELQFFLRGVLQDLDIAVDYAPELPLTQDIFRSLQESVREHPPALPPQYADLLEEKAAQIWQQAPWEILADHQILAIDLNQWDLQTLYVSVMGLLGMEYGILFYRSLDSLRQFREQVGMDVTTEEMEAAFLRQDCLFLTFEARDPDLAEVEDLDLATLPFTAIEPGFGNLHPLEGIRPFLYEEEAIAVYVALEALHRFFRRHRSRLQTDFPSLSSQFQIPLPDLEKSTITVKVATLPELAAELLQFADAEDDSLDLGSEAPLLREDLIPEGAFFSLGAMPWEMVEQVRQVVKHRQSGETMAAGDGLPILLIQTSQPKAKVLIETLQAEGGVQGISFNPGEDPLEGDRYDLGIIQTQIGQMHLFGEYLAEDPVHLQARKKWDQRCKKTGGWCGLVVARGLKGASRGNPQLRDMLALFEVRYISAAELGLGMLQLIPHLEWE